MLSTTYIIGFAIAVLMALIFTPVFIRMAYIVGAIDQPDHRKVHANPTPRFGGPVLVVSVVATLGMLLLFDPWLVTTLANNISSIIGIAIGFGILFLIGLTDDIRPISAGIKFLVQTCAALVVVIFGELYFSAITLPLSGDLLHLGWAAVPLSVFWILAITNAINLIDGLDGLATGIACIASLTIASISIMSGHESTGLIMFLVAGTLIGFLRFNFNPAKIFLGDAGSLILGFTLAIGAMQASAKTPAVFALVVAISILALPILDTTVAMARRFLRPWLPAESSEASISLKQRLKTVFLPDKSHIHHRLLARGWSQRKSVLNLYFISLVFGLCAILLSYTTSFSFTFLLVAFTLMYGWAVVRKMRCSEIAVFRNGIVLTRVITPLIQRHWFLHTLDFLAFTAAVTLSWLLLSTTSGWILPALVVGVSFGMFKGLRRFYHEPYKQIGLGDALSLIRSLVISVFAGWVTFVGATGRIVLSEVSLFIMIFYLTATLILASRLSHDILLYLFRKNRLGDKKVLIYGTNNTGMLALSRLLEQQAGEASPIGFLDDNPAHEGQVMNGYTVFGGHWKLPRLLKTHHIDEILIAEPQISAEVVRRLQSLAESNGIALHTFHWQLKHLPLTESNQESLKSNAVKTSIY